MRLLLRLGEYGNGVFYLNVLAVVGEGFVRCPRLEEHFKGFLELAARLGEVAAKACHLVALVAAPYAAHEPAVDKVVQHGNLFG